MKLAKNIFRHTMQRKMHDLMYGFWKPTIRGVPPKAKCVFIEGKAMTQTV